MNTDVLAKNLELMALKEEMEMEKEILERQSCSSRAEVSFQSNKKKLDEQVIAEREVRETDLKMSDKNVSGKLRNTGVRSFARRTFTTPKIRTFTTPKFGHLPPPKTLHLPGGQLPPPIFFLFLAHFSWLFHFQKKLEGS